MAEEHFLLTRFSDCFYWPYFFFEVTFKLQFAKHHVPETHPKDTEDFVEKRVRALVRDGATAACVAISKTESKNTLELLARALLAFTEFPDLRGQILSEGGAKVMLLWNLYFSYYFITI